MVSWLAEPFTYHFMVRGLLAGVLTGLGCAILSAFIVWRGMSFIGDALAHAILPGIVIAFMQGISLIAGALAAAVLAALGIGVITKGTRLKEDSAIGVMFTGFFALGILLLSRITSYQDLSHILFGDILGISWPDLAMMAAVVAVVLAGVFAFYKELLVTSFDPGHSVVIGLSPELVRYGLLLLLALVVVTAIQAVGVVMVLAMLVTPAATASLVTRRLPRVMALGAGLAILAALVGLYASYYANVASGAAIVLTMTGFFILAFFLAPERGLLSRLLRRVG
jgi:ABC-type Mn2+/Zn2+ transport system permease subunit